MEMMTKKSLGMETVKVENMKPFFVDQWEANGYDDSDGDVITYNGETKEIEHHFWTTRCYCPSTINTSMCESLENGIKEGKINEEDVKKAIIKDFFGKNDTLGLHDIYYLPSNKTLNIPCKLLSRGKVKYEGILVTIQTTYYTNYFGYKCERSYGFVYNPQDKSLNKTKLHNIELNVSEEMEKNLFYKIITNGSLNFLCKLYSHKGAQFSGPTYYIDYLLKDAYPLIDDNFLSMVEVDNSTKKSGMSEKWGKIHAEKVNQKFISYKNWVDTLEGKDEDEKKYILRKTLKKYLSKEIEKGYDYLNEEVKNVLTF